MIAIIKYKKLDISPSIPKMNGGVYKKIIISARGISEAIIQGILLPHFECVRSERPPNNWSLIAFQIDQITNPIDIKTTLIRTIVK
jgi:hypothetical protein